MRSNAAPQPFKSKCTLKSKGMKDSVGSNLKKHGFKILLLVTRDNICLRRLSFRKPIKKDTRSAIINQLSSLQSLEYVDLNLPFEKVLRQVKGITRAACQINNKSTLKKSIATIKSYKPADAMEESVQDICLQILKQHDKMPFMFHQDRINLYSEADYVVKFWSPLIESFFGCNEELFIHWGDTTSKACRSSKLAIKLDMRMMIMKHSKYIIDGASGEYAKKPFSSKYFKDRIKLVLATKAYMNSLISSCRHIDNAGILNFKIPFLQIMGFEAQLSMLFIQDKELYVVEDLQKFYFPITKQHIRKGGINDLVKAFSPLKSLLDNLKEAIEDGQLDSSSKLTYVQEETRPPRSNYKAEWISEVICPAESSEKEGGSDDDDDEEEEESVGEDDVDEESS